MLAVDYLCLHVTGGSDSFTYSWPWLGQLQRLTVWHDNSGAAAGRGPWHLEAVEVSSSREQQVSRDEWHPAEYTAVVSILRDVWRLDVCLSCTPAGVVIALCCAEQWWCPVLLLTLRGNQLLQHVT
jgi:hypothetical protein